MRIHYLQHVPHEGIGTMEDWIRQKKYSLSRTRLFANDPLPEINDIDWLLVMGGPMSVNDEDTLPWLIKEKQFVKRAIDTGKTVLGFCLGSQMIANVLGARVYKNPCKEIGWFDLDLTKEGQASGAFSRFPKQLKVYQWHGETFDLPQGCALAATSQYCKNQALVFNERVIGMQFHLEVTREDVRSWTVNAANELTDENYIQSPDEMLGRTEEFGSLKKYMFRLLDNLTGKNTG
jgi:GMP synthase (glutamine-hydrolysing)